MPTLPLFIKEALGASEAQVGIVVGLFTVTAVLVRPWSGMLIDQLGRRSVFVISLLAYVVVISGYLVVHTIWLMWILRLLHGGAFGVTTTATVTIASDVVPPSRRGEGLGYFGTSAMVAMTIGPVIGLAIANGSSFQTMFAVSIAISALAFFLSRYIRLSEPETKRTFDLRIDVRQWKALIEPRVFPLASSILALAFVFGGVSTFISLYAAQLGDESLAGQYFMVYALAIVLSRPVSGRLYDRKGPDLVIYPGMLLYLMGMVVLGLSNGAIMLLLAGFIIGIGYGSIQPSIQARVIDLVEPHRRGSANATFFSAIDLGIGLGSFLFGFVVKYWGFQNMFLFSGIFVVLSCWLYYRARREEKLCCGK